MMLHNSRRRAFTLLEIIIVIGIITLLIGFLLPAVERARHRGYLASCANNLRQIGLAISQYENDNHGEFPRTKYDPAVLIPNKGTGVASLDPFSATGPTANDVTAAMYLVIRAQKLPPVIFNCPYNDVYTYDPDKADVLNRSNFTDYKKNCGYSIANPYPDSAAAGREYHLNNHVSAQFPLMSDINAGMTGRNNVLAPTVSSPAKIKQQANSPNHEKDGQNVLFGDGHVAWCQDVFCGIDNDNIFTTKAGQIEASPVDKTDAVLLPVAQ